MMNRAIEWIKAHPGESAAIGGVVVLAAIFLLRGSTPVDPQAQLQEQELAAHVQMQQLNATTGVQMAAIAAQNKQVELAAQVQEQQTAAAVKVAQLQTDAQNNAVNQQVGLLSQVYKGQQQLSEEQLQQYVLLSNKAAGDITKINGSQNRLALWQSILGQPGAAAATEGSYSQQALGTDSMWASIVSSLAKSVSGIIGTLFG